MLAGNFPHRGAALALIALILTTAAHAQQTQIVLLGTGTPPSAIRT